jgi:hypothetical protein
MKTINPPSSLEIEKALLYCIIMKNDFMKNCILTENDFYHEQNRIIFRIAAELSEERQEFDYAIIDSMLDDRNLLSKVGGSSYIISFAETGASVAMFGVYQNKLKELSARRMLLNAVQKMTRICTGEESIEEGLQESISSLTDISRSLTKTSRSLADRVKEWILVTSGNFLVTDVYRDLGIVTPGNKKAVLMALNRLEGVGEIIKCGDKRGCYKPVDIDLERIDFMGAEEEEYRIFWPAAVPVHEVVKLYPGNLVIIQGEPDSGKTAMMLNLIKDSMHLDHVKSINYFSSEMAKTELKIRLQFFEKEGIPMSFWENSKFTAWERSADFSEVIRPDGLNLIDYVELHEEHYLIGKILMHIWRKLKSGIAIVAVQKDPGKKYGKGGPAIFEKPRLILTLEPGKAIIMKGKNRRLPNVDPKSKIYHYRIIDGCRFLAKNKTTQSQGADESPWREEG